MARLQEARMLTATLETVDERGYSKLTVAQITERAGVSRKTFYDLFADCEECFVATVNWAIDQVAPAVIEAYRTRSSWRDGVRAALAVLLGFFDAAPAFAQLLVVEAVTSGNRAEERRHEIFERLAAAIDGGRDGAPPGEDPLPVAGEAAVGAVWSILNTRLTHEYTSSLLSLHGTLMSVIVLAYLGQETAREELSRPAPQAPALPQPTVIESLAVIDGSNMRVTYRTLRVLSVIGDHPGRSNREIARAAGIADQGQISKLLTRLQDLEFIQNTGLGHKGGAANEWSLTPKGERLVRQYWPAGPPD
jgi:AcrR family transcriptional regulator/DNA-binding MarR family transcriptional regulator